MNQEIRKGIIIFCLLTLGIMKCYTQEQDKNKILWTAIWSNDGNFIAVGGDDKRIRIYDGHTFELLRIYTNESEVKRIRWHPIKNILAIAATDNGSEIIDVENDRTIKFQSGDNIGGRSIAWNFNGELVAIADYEGVLTIWTKNGQLINTIKKNDTKSYVAIDWHPFKNEIIVLGDHVRIYNDNGGLLKKFKHRNENVLMLCVKWHKSGKFFVIGDYGNNKVPYKPLLQFWNSNGTLIRQIDISRAEYRNLSWNKIGNRLATASDAIRIWSKKGKLLKTGSSEDNLWGVDWSPNGKYVVTSSHFGKIIVWDRNANVVRKLN